MSFDNVSVNKVTYYYYYYYYNLKHSNIITCINEDETTYINGFRMVDVCSGDIVTTEEFFPCSEYFTFAKIEAS